MSHRLAVVIALTGCGAAPLQPADPFGPFVVLAGPVEGGVTLTEHTRAAVAWMGWTEGRLGVAVEEVAAQLHPSGVAITLTGPPSVPLVAGAGDPPPVSEPVAWGLPLLVEVAQGQEVVATVDGSALLDWARDDGALGGISLDAGVVTAFAGSTLIAVAGSAPEWPQQGPWCRLSALQPGLVVYRAVGSGCGGWQPVAPAGSRTEIQGIEWTGAAAR